MTCLHCCSTVPTFNVSLFNLSGFSVSDIGVGDGGGLQPPPPDLGQIANFWAQEVIFGRSCYAQKLLSCPKVTSTDNFRRQLTTYLFKEAFK